MVPATLQSRPDSFLKLTGVASAAPAFFPIGRHPSWHLNAPWGIVGWQNEALERGDLVGWAVIGKAEPKGPGQNRRIAMKESKQF